MELWQKILIIVAAVFLIVIFINWWMSYDQLTIIVSSDNLLSDNMSIPFTITLSTMDDREIFNQSNVLNKSKNIVIKNITNMAGNYNIKVVTNSNVSKKEIKYGKYFEKIEIIFENDNILIRNERDCITCN